MKKSLKELIGKDIVTTIDDIRVLFLIAANENHALVYDYKKEKVRLLSPFELLLKEPTILDEEMENAQKIAILSGKVAEEHKKYTTEYFLKLSSNLFVANNYEGEKKTEIVKDENLGKMLNKITKNTLLKKGKNFYIQGIIFDTKKSMHEALIKNRFNVNFEKDGAGCLSEEVAKVIKDAQNSLNELRLESQNLLDEENDL